MTVEFAGNFFWKSSPTRLTFEMDFGELIDPETRAFWEDYDERELGWVDQNRVKHNLVWW